MADTSMASLDPLPHESFSCWLFLFDLISFPIVLVSRTVNSIITIFVLIPIFFILSHIKRIFCCQERICQRGKELVEGGDAIWFQETPENLMYINAVLFFREIKFDDVVSLVETVIARKQENPKLFGRFFKVPKRGGVCGLDTWEEDVNFNINNHIQRAQDVVEKIGAELPQDEKSLEQFVATFSTYQLDHDHPLWHFTVIENYKQDQCALLFRIHHVMADGIALAQILVEEFLSDEPILPDTPRSTKKGNYNSQTMLTMNQIGQTEDEPVILRKSGYNSIQPSPNEKPSVGFKSPRNIVFLFLHAMFTGPLSILQKIFWFPDRSMFHGPRLVNQKKASWSKPLSVDSIKQVKNELGCTINDLILSCFASALDSYSKERGQVLSRFRIVIPVNVRFPDEPLELRNKFSVVFLPLPVGKSSLRNRLIHGRSLMKKIKTSTEPLFTYWSLVFLLNYGPSWFSKFLLNFIANKASAILTNVPGPTQTKYWGRHPVESIVFWVPQRSNIGIGLSALTYDGQLRVGALCDTAVLEDPEDIIKKFEEEMNNCFALIPHV